MKEIVVAVTNDLSYDQRMIRTCSTLTSAGYSVTLVGRTLKNSDPLAQRPFKQIRMKCKVNKGPLFYAEYNHKLLGYLNKMDFDLAVACDLDTILAVARAAKSSKCPFIFDAHEFFTEVPELNSRNIVRSIWSGIGKRYVPGAKHCYTVGSALAEELSIKYGRTFDVVRNVPKQLNRDLLSREDRDQVIFYQGALNEGRGLEVLIDSMEILMEFELHLAGEGDLSTDLRLRVKHLGLQERVKFLGRVSPGELPGLTSRALVGINILERASKSYFLSLSNKFFDYMHAGTPSINMDFPEYKTILSGHQTGITIDSLSVDTLSGEIRRIVNDRVLWSRLSQNCLEARTVYCWENEQKNLLDIFESAMT